MTQLKIIVKNAKFSASETVNITYRINHALIFLQRAYSGYFVQVNRTNE